MCRTLAPLLPHKRRRLLQPEVAHRRYGLHFPLLIFILLTWHVCVFAQLSFFQRTLYLTRRKTGAAKQAPMLNILLSQISLAYSNIIPLWQGITASRTGNWFFFDWEREKRPESMLNVRPLIGLSTSLQRALPEYVQNFTWHSKYLCSTGKKGQRRRSACFVGAD